MVFFFFCTLHIWQLLEFKEHIAKGLLKVKYFHKKNRILILLEGSTSKILKQKETEINWKWNTHSQLRNFFQTNILPELCSLCKKETKGNCDISFQSRLLLILSYDIIMLTAERLIYCSLTALQFIQKKMKSSSCYILFFVSNAYVPISTFFFRSLTLKWGKQ